MKSSRLSAARARLKIAAAIAMAVLPVTEVAFAASPAPGSARPAAATGTHVAVRGTVEARRHAVISSEIAGRIISLPHREGESFRKDEVIVSLDCAMYQAQLAGARADLAIATQTLASNRELEKRNAISSFDVAISAAERDRALANARISEINVSRCQIRAPYDGNVIATLVNENESITPGSQLVSIVGNASVQIRLAMPSDTLRWIKPGVAFQFATDDGTPPVTATVATVGAHIDLVNRSVLVIGQPTSQHGLLSGMNGTAAFDLKR